MKPLAILLALATTAHADVAVIDGDTIRGDPANLRLTLRGGAPYDAPETWRPECVEEAELGHVATARLIDLLTAPARVTVHILPGTCGFGRGCAWIEIDGRDAGAVLISEGLALPVRNADWCEEAG